MKNLVSLQEEALRAIMTARPQGPRAAGYGITLLNRNPRTLQKIRKQYQRQAMQLGYSPNQVADQWEDIKDVAKLRGEH